MEQHEMTREEGQVGENPILVRLETKVDALTGKVDTLSGRVIQRETYCKGAHERVDEKLKEDRSRIMTLEKEQKGDQSAKDKVSGAWTTIGIVAGSLVAGGGLVLGVLKLIARSSG